VMVRPRANTRALSAARAALAEGRDPVEAVMAAARV
jgi:hypothetical protein